MDLSNTINSTVPLYLIRRFALDFLIPTYFLTGTIKTASVPTLSRECR